MSEQTIWVVMYDDDTPYVGAAFTAKYLAEEHAAQALGTVHECKLHDETSRLAAEYQD